MSDEMFTDFEVIIGTEHTDPEDRDLAIAHATHELTSAHAELTIWRVNTYDDRDDDCNIGVGFNVEVPDDEVVEFENALGPVVETIERI